MKNTLFLVVVVFLVGCASPPRLNPAYRTLPQLEYSFNDNYNNFDIDNALYAAGLANVSYEEDPLTARRQLMSAPYNMSCVDLVYIPHTDRRVLLARENNRLFISVNGSGPINDWLNDAKFFKYETVNEGADNPYTNIPDGAAGFRRLYSEMRNGFSEVITLSPCFNRSEQLDIYYTAHSLGSALGVIGAKVLCQEEGICFSGMFLFASPLVTKPHVFEDEEAFPSDKIIVFQNYRDYVVRGGNRVDFGHPGRVYILENGKAKEFDKATPYTKYSWWEKISFRIAKDHPMDSYIDSLESIKASGNKNL